MFYSELLSTPINSYNVKRLYGVNPDNDPERAALIGIYPLTEAPEGYSVVYYQKENNNTYTAVPFQLSNTEVEDVRAISTIRDRLSAIESDEVNDDAVSSALLTLVASINARLTALENT